MGMLKDLGLVKSTKSRTGRMFESLVPNFLELRVDSASSCMKKRWSEYRHAYHSEDVGTH